MGQPSYTREGGTGAHRSSFLDQLQPPSFRGSVVKNPPPNAGDAGDSDLILGLERSPAGGNGNPFQYSCLENSMDRGVCWATVHGGCRELDTTERLSIKVPLSHSTYSVYSSSYTHCYFKHSTKFIFKILKRCFCVFPDWHSTKLHSFLFFLSSF